MTSRLKTGPANNGHSEYTGQGAGNAIKNPERRPGRASPIIVCQRPAAEAGGSGNDEGSMMSGKLKASGAERGEPRLEPKDFRAPRKGTKEECGRGLTTESRGHGGVRLKSRTGIHPQMSQISQMGRSEFGWPAAVRGEYGRLPSFFHL